MKTIATRQSWNLLGTKDSFKHKVVGNLGTVTNDPNSDYGVSICMNDAFIGNVNPGESRTFSTNPGDMVRVVSGPGATKAEFASGQILG